jgi:transposase InsO family protein
MSRQAYYKHQGRDYKEKVKEEILLQLISVERKKMPRLGGRKLIHKLKPQLVGELQIGRDKFFDFLRGHDLLVRRRRYRPHTTMSNHWLRKYKNLIKDYEPTAANQLWVSDITYINTSEGFAYLFLITDAYSRKIIGWSMSRTLHAEHALRALYMALSQLPAGGREVIHHSDRGVQYCSNKYVRLLMRNGFKISMSEDGNPLDNAIAERVNGILKDEWINELKIKSAKAAMKKVRQVINIYNSERPHSSVDMLTPDQAHSQSGNLKRHWKNYWREKNVKQIMDLT